MRLVKRALILGALAGQVDAIQELQSRGVYTVACGHKPEGPGVEAADEFVLADITNVSEIRSLAERLKVDLVYSVGSDIAMPTAVAVSETLGLPYFHGSKLTRILRRKEELRKLLADAGLSPVAYEYVRTPGAIAWTTFPCIVKPVDAQGQRGITVVQDADDLLQAVVVACSVSSSGDAIIEELLEGPEVSAHVIVSDSEVMLTLPSDRYVWRGGLVGIPAAHSFPLRSATQVYRADIHDLVRKTVAALGVSDGPLYFQMILTKEGPRIVEIASRLDGCHLWRMLHSATGYNLLADVLGRLLGDPWRLHDGQSASPRTLRFYLGAPGVPLTEEHRARMQTADAEFVEWQLEPGGFPRRTNDVVSRLGYEIVKGLPG